MHGNSRFVDAVTAVGLGSSLLLAPMLTAGCTASELPPLGQVLLYVDTDAPLPPPPGEQPGSDEPAALFDTLYVEIIEPGSSRPCPGCTRTFALNRALFERREVSFGIPTEPGRSGYRVRLRLYHWGASLTALVPDALPDGSPPPSVIDVTVALPTVDEEGIVERTVLLETETVGLPVGSLEDPVDTSAGAPSSSRVGTWPGAQRVPCTSEPADGEVCIPGGAYWMGNPRMRGVGLGDAANIRRLVVVSPFFVTGTEVTVAQYRAFDDGSQYELYAWSGNSTGDHWRDFCTFTPAPDIQDDKPVLCVSYAGARAYCQWRGSDLPTEAQIEYVASALEGRLFVWGSDEPNCKTDAVLERWGYGMFQGEPPCKPDEAPGGAEPVGPLSPKPRRDVLELPTGTVYDLVGNATEWALDLWNRQTEPCWSHGGVYVNPLCQEPSAIDGSAEVFRTGSWIVGGRQAAASYRNPLNEIRQGQGIDLGFRCARPAVP